MIGYGHALDHFLVVQHFFAIHQFVQFRAGRSGRFPSDAPFFFK